ncbi:unnamed protein product, partial [Rhizoctonia solani]
MDVNKLQEAHVATYKLPPDAVAFANFPTAYGPVTISGDDFLPRSTTTMIQSGQYANIPIISGCQSRVPVILTQELISPFLPPANLDEGTWFAAATSVFLDLFKFLNSNRPGLAIGISPLVSAGMCALYPNVPSAGSPYNTGSETFGRSKNYKWAAAVVGDYLFTAPRRQFIRAAASRGQNVWRQFIRAAASRGQNVWSYIFSQPTAGSPPEYGISHTSELSYVFGGLPSNATQGSKDVSDKMMQY